MPEGNPSAGGEVDVGTAPVRGAQPDADGARRGSGQPDLGHAHVPPGDPHEDPATCSQPVDLALGPGLGQRGQQVQVVGVALEEHLGDRGREAQVPVDLERRVRAEEVRVEPAAVRGGPALQRARRRLDRPQREPHLVVGPVAAPEPGPQRGPPGEGPTGRLGAAQVEAPRRGPAQVGVLLGGQAPQGEQSHEVREVPVLGLGLGQVLGPLEHAPAGPYPGGREERDRGLEVGQPPGGVARRATRLHERLVRRAARRREVAQQGDVHGGRPRDRRGRAVGREVAVLRRRRRRGPGLAGDLDEPVGVAPRVGADPVQREESRALEHGPRHVAQIAGIRGEHVVVPDVAREPGPAQRPARPGRVAVPRTHGPGMPPDVGVVVRDPPARPVERRGRARPGAACDAGREGEQGLVALGEVGGLGGPVVHGRVDVERVAAAPRSGELVVPQSLQRRGEATGS
ncbi:hypothetical protein OERS_33330 [Oerskovia enterophila]|uniref:Uncharacterized protein n=1 Tax=Oerskovia enterophila TaxID=43678 RepID=A0ABX2Y2E2_9CELL|nr:hypothetical protein OERS_33330 [Oerskovia enterophila]